MKKYKKPPEETPPTVVPKSVKREIKPEDQELSPAWFRKNFEKYRDQAVQNPHDTEAMRTYLYLEKYMREQALEFGYARQAAVFADPFLDATANKSTANFGMKAMNEQASKNKSKLLEDLGERSGIFFFYRSDCPYCKQQAPLIDLLGKQYGFSIQPVSLDGKPIPDSPWDSYLTNTDQAQILGVTKVPAMYLYNPETKQLELIAMGLQSLTQLEQRIVYSANRSGLITDEEMKITRSTDLYPDIDGHIGTTPTAPKDSPETFKKLFKKHQEHKQNILKKEFSYDEK
ncbi:conjugal transfer protein TraF [Psychromonas sp. KJ10-2]|uniref:conjugal transfer protein TraF n=1 Tax=Psychromonas sp. KJ10-2 TaxID=3391822 RepID=UPI0039B51090